MTKLLIAERDERELKGIQWLLHSYLLPIEHVMAVSNETALIENLEKELPDILCIELDMLSNDKWMMTKDYITNYAKQVIAITAEATFERAMQAMEVQAIDLWVKPHSPNEIKHTLKKSIRSIQQQEDSVQTDRDLNAITYQSLFVDNSTPYEYPIFLLQTESNQELVNLRIFLSEFDFQVRPTIFPLSDLVVTVFSDYFHNIQQEAIRLLKEWEFITETPLVLVIHQLNGKQSLNQAYLQARKSLELTFYKGYRQVIDSTSAWEWRAMDPFLTTSEQRKWVDMLINGNIDELKSWMYQQFFNIDLPYPDPRIIRTRLTSILAQVRRIMNTYHLYKTEIEQLYQDIFKKVHYSPVLYRIVQEMLLFIYKMLDQIEVQKKQTRLDVVEQAIMYMEKHFADSELTLKRVAESVDRNPSYLSNLFTKKYGKTFRKLLTDIRIREAKRMLNEMDISIQLIAEKSGFTNQHYFSRIFKGQTGVPPSLYQRNKMS